MINILEFTPKNYLTSERRRETITDIRGENGQNGSH